MKWSREIALLEKMHSSSRKMKKYILKITADDFSVLAAVLKLSAANFSITQKKKKWLAIMSFSCRLNHLEFQKFVVQSLGHVQLFASPWTAAHQASPVLQSLLKLMSIESMMPSNHFILCHHLLLLPSIFPSITLLQWVGPSHQVAKVLEFQLQPQSFQWIFTVDFL